MPTKAGLERYIWLSVFKGALCSTLHSSSSSSSTMEPCCSLSLTKQAVFNKPEGWGVRGDVGCCVPSRVPFGFGISHSLQSNRVFENSLRPACLAMRLLVHTCAPVWKRCGGCRTFVYLKNDYVRPPCFFFLRLFRCASHFFIFVM